MKFTIGKLVWSISIIIFLVIAYNQGTFTKMYNVITNKGVVEIQSFTLTVEPSQIDRAPLEDVSSVTDTSIELYTDAHLQMELLKYRVQQLENECQTLKVQMTTAHAEKSDSMDNLMAIMTTLMPIIIPYLTRKSNNKEITVFKKR